MITAEYRKHLRDERKTNGLCARCGKEPAILDRVNCDSCRLKHNDDSRDRKIRLLFDAKCVTCGKEHDSLNQICDRCYSKRSSSANKMMNLRKRRLSSGFCVSCGKEPHLPDMVRCEKCRLYHKNDAKSRAACKKNKID